MGLTTAIYLLKQAIAELQSEQSLQQSEAGQAAEEAQSTGSTGRREIAWGSHVSPLFRERVWWIADNLDLNPDDLMGAIAFESGKTFSPSVKNAAGSGATGLIQFMPSTAIALGTSTTKLAQMTAENQLNFVYKYLKPYAGRLSSLEDIYMSILWPKAVGKPLDYALFTGGIAYRQNAGLDNNKNGIVTKQEAAAKVRKVRDEGLLPKNLG